MKFPNFCCESLKKEKGEFWKGFILEKKIDKIQTLIDPQQARI